MKKLLHFTDLSERHQGISLAVSMSLAEAVRVCMDRHHASPAEFEVNDNRLQFLAGIDWEPADRRVCGVWANKDNATEHGACGLALAAIELSRGFVAVRQAETRTGSDYYLSLPGDVGEDLEASYRLEVSGTNEGNLSVINARLRQKTEQARRGQSNLPAIATVVGFGALKIVSADVEEK